MPDFMTPEKSDALVTPTGLPWERFHAWMDGMTEYVNAGFDNIVFVEDLTDFPTPVSGVITLESGMMYLVNGQVSIGANRIEWGTSGHIVGHSNAHDGLIYTGTGTLFTGTTSLFMKNVAMTATNSASTFISFTGAGGHTEVISLNGVPTSGFGTIGTITDINTFASILTQFAGFITGGLTFAGSGNLSLFFTSSTLVAAGSNALTVLDLGSSTWDALILETSRLETSHATQTALKGIASSGNIVAPGTGTVSGVNFDGPGANLSLITNADLRWRFNFNTGGGGVEDSVNRGSMTMQNNATATVVGAGWPQKTLGTRVAGNLSRFTFNADGTLTYIGIPDIRLSGIINCSPQVTAGANQTISLYPAVDGSILTAFASTVVLKTGDVKSVTIPYEADLVTGQTVDLWVDNTSGTISVLIVSEKHIVEGF